MSILRFLGIGEASGSRKEGSKSSRSSRTVKRITETLDHFTPERARRVASFAYTLSRVANADLDISEVETRAMTEIVQQQGGLDEAEAAVVVDITKEHATLFGGTENFIVTREFGAHSSPEEKKALLRCLFAVSAADHIVTPDEEQEIKKISEELGMVRNDFLAVRLEYREHLSIFKDRPEGGT